MGGGGVTVIERVNFVGVLSTPLHAMTVLKFL